MLQKCLCHCVLLLLIACGGGSDGSPNVSNLSDGGGAGGSIQPSVPTALVVINHAVTPRAIDSRIDSLRFSVFDQNGVLVFGPTERSVAPRIELQVPTTGTRLQIEYLSQRVVLGRFEAPLNLSEGSSFTLDQPSWQDSTLTLNPNSIILPSGLEQTVTATVNGQPVQASLVSDQPSVVSIQGSRVRAEAEGTAQITASFQGLTRTISVNVTAAQVNELRITPNEATVEVGSTVGFRLSASFTDGTTSDVTGQGVWSSDSPGVGDFEPDSALFECFTQGQAQARASFAGIEVTGQLNVGEPSPPQPSPPLPFERFLGGQPIEENFFRSCTSGDFNGDTHIDLAAHRHESNEVVLFFGDGTGGFPTRATLVINGSSGSIGARDMNNDGALDLIGFAGNDIVVAFNDGAANFDVRTYDNGAAINSVTFGDLNGDILPDLLVHSGDSYRPVLNQTGTQFSFGAEVSIGATAGVTLQLAPMDPTAGDELFITVPAQFGQRTTEYFRNNGAGVFTTAQSFPAANSSPVIGDLNQDGDLDMAAGFSYFVNDGNGFLSELTGGLGSPSLTYMAPQLAGQVSAIVDFDGDGINDHLNSTFTNRINVFQGRSASFATDNLYDLFSEEFESFQLGTGFSIFVDLNGDSRLDVVRCDFVSREKLAVFLNGPDGLVQGVTRVAPGGVDRLVVGDLDGDNRHDILSFVDFGSFRVFLTQALGGLIELPTVASGSVSQMQVLDYDGDTVSDLLASGVSTTGILLYRGLGGGALGTPEDLTSGMSGGFDARQDRLVLGTISKLAVFAEGQETVLLEERTNSVRFADLDGSSPLDVVSFGRSVSVFLRDGETTVRYDWPTLTTQGDLFVADLDGDNDDDVLFASSDCFILENRSGQYLVKRPLPVDTLPFGAVIQDFDLDNDKDLLFVLSGRGLVFRNGGGFSYDEPVVLDLARTESNGVQVFDHDQDGDPDLLFDEGPVGGLTVLDNSTNP